MERRSGRARVILWGSTALMLAGAALLLATASYLVYGRIAEASLSSLRQTAVTAPAAPAGPDGDAGEVRAWGAAPLTEDALKAAAEDGWGARLLDGTPAAAAPAAIPFVSQVSFPGAVQIAIPRLEIDSPVTELGTKYVNGELVWDTPKFAVGHHQGTAQPGEIGNAVFSGHISSPLSHEGNVFSRLPEIKLGDVVMVTSPAAVIWFTVTETKVVDPSHVEVMNPTPDPQITLITCVPDWVYTHRLVVTARPTRWAYPPAAAQ